MIKSELMKKIMFPPNLLRLCIDNFDGQSISGSIFGVAVPKVIAFTDMADFAVKIDEVYNQVGQPQPFHVMRSFNEQVEYHAYKGKPITYFSSVEVDAHKGKLLSLNMVMTSRQGAEWQGIFKDLDGNIIGKYKTVLECIKCIENFIKTI